MKYNCLNNNGEILGVTEAADDRQALDKARKLNKNVVAVEPRPDVNREAPRPKEE
jgi:hypothetical protein